MSDSESHDRPQERLSARERIAARLLSFGFCFLIFLPASGYRYGSNPNLFDWDSRIIYAKGITHHLSDPEWAIRFGATWIGVLGLAAILAAVLVDSSDRIVRKIDRPFVIEYLVRDKLSLWACRAAFISFVVVFVTTVVM